MRSRCGGIDIKDLLLSLKEYFKLYLQLYLPSNKWIALYLVLFLILFYHLKKRGCVKQYSNSIASFIAGMFFSIECSSILTLTLTGRIIGDKRDFYLLPFESYIRVITEENMELFLQIVMNIVMYIPLGFLLPCCFMVFDKYRYVLVVTAGASLIIELIQLVSKVGLFETDDIINNVFGALIGISFYALFVKIKRKENVYSLTL